MDEAHDQDIGDIEVSVVDQPIVDNTGLIRVGPQPVSAMPPLSTVPNPFANGLLWDRVKRNLSRTDSKLGMCGNDEQRGLHQELLSTLMQEDTDTVSRLDDYTGTPLSFTPGPLTYSLEAVYHFGTTPSGDIGYHTVPNCVATSRALNFVKKRYPVTVLPLLATLLRPVHKPRFVWAFNAICNVSTLHAVFVRKHCSKALEFEQWRDTPESTRRDILEAMRTLQPSQTVRAAIESTERTSFLERGWFSHRAVHRIAQPDIMYQTMVGIAAQYGLTPSEFAFYMTIPAPAHRPGERVFYPFHVLSHQQALVRGWDWRHMETLATVLLQVMREHCNKHAEKLSLGEAVEWQTLTYWMAAHTSQKVQRLKSTMPADVSPEHIRLSLLDRWGLPMVPWTGSPLTVSLCKGPDHGIAMKFGIVECDTFDPLKHIDLQKCTVTLDTQATNIAMSNWEPHTWPSIRTHLSHVTLRHPLWRIDDAAGMSV